MTTMKNLFLLIALSTSIASFAQSDSTKKEAPLVIVEQMPEFIGGNTAMTKYIQKNFQYPPEAHKLKEGAKCYVTFVVEKDGAVDEVRVLKGVAGCPTCDAEAVRVVSSMPNWTPGMQNGRKVRTQFNLPLMFRP